MPNGCPPHRRPVSITENPISLRQLLHQQFSKSGFVMEPAPPGACLTSRTSTTIRTTLFVSRIYISPLTEHDIRPYLPPFYPAFHTYTPMAIARWPCSHKPILSFTRYKVSNTVPVKMTSRERNCDSSKTTPGSRKFRNLDAFVVEWNHLVFIISLSTHTSLFGVCVLRRAVYCVVTSSPASGVTVFHLHA